MPNYNQLTQYIEQIKNEKDTKLLPENIRKGITILNVTGDSINTSIEKYIYGGTSNNANMQQFIINIDEDLIVEETGTNVFYNCKKLKSIKSVDISKVSIVKGMFTSCNKLQDVKIIGFGNNITDCSSLFQGCSNLTSSSLNVSDIAHWNTSNVTDMSNMFSGCVNLTDLNISNWNTNNVINMNSMFRNCNNLTQLDLNNLNTSNVTNMNYMFSGCSNLTDLNISNWNTNNVISMESMFSECANIKNIYGLTLLNIGNLKSLNSMFKSCGIEELDLSNWAQYSSNFTNVSNMFQYSKIKKLNLSNWDLSNVKSLYYMFCSCSNISFDFEWSSVNTSNVTDMSSMFCWIDGIKELDVHGMNTSNVTTMSSMFAGVITDGRNSIETLNITGFDCGKVTNVTNIFNRSSNLINIIGTFQDLGKGYIQKTARYSNYTLDLSPCYKLTHDSLMNIINGLYDLNLTYDVANGGTLYSQVLNLGNTNRTKLTAEEIAVATSKRLECNLIL